MDDSELKQRVIGLATQIYHARRDGKDPDGSEVTAGLSPLIEGFSAYDLRFVEPQTPEAVRAVIFECAEKAVDQVGGRAFHAVSEMITLFCDFAQYAEQTSPHVNVPEFLRQAGLRAASGE